MHHPLRKCEEVASLTRSQEAFVAMFKPTVKDPEQVAELHELISGTFRIETGHGLRCRECESIGLHADWFPFAEEEKCVG